MESGPNRVNAPLGGPVIPRSRRDLCKDQSFASVYNAYTRADKWPAGDAAGKVRGGDGRGSAPGSFKLVFQVGDLGTSSSLLKPAS